MKETVGEALGIKPEIDQEIYELIKRVVKESQAPAEGLKKLLQEDLNSKELAVAAYYLACMGRRIKRTAETPPIFAMSSLEDSISLQDLEKMGRGTQNPQCPCEECPEAGNCMLEPILREVFSDLPL